MPSTGASRPGPANIALDRIRSDVVAPIGLAIETAGIDAGIETLRVVDGAMQDPSGPWIVAWYDNLGDLGKIGNVVMAGHIDYWNVGPAVFYNLSTLEPGERDRRHRRRRQEPIPSPSNGSASTTRRRYHWTK